MPPQVTDVPDFRHVPEKLFATGLYDLTDHDGNAAFVDAVVATLNGRDPNFVHLRKSAGQTHVHRHGEDSVLYKFPDGTALAVDFTVGAGGANPRPGWNVGSFVYKHSDGHDPDDHGIGAVAPPPVTVFVPDRGEMMHEGEMLDAYYSSQEGLQRVQGLSKNGRPDWEGVGAWLFDVYLRARMSGKTREQSRADYIAAIRQSLEWQSKHPGETP